jgi:Protein of unknown function (DUF4031)
MKYFCDNKRHLVCYPFSVENLHAMAVDLGIKRCWFHSSKIHPHYDIPKRRIQEIQNKCEIITSRQIIDIIKGNNIE